VPLFKRRLCAQVGHQSRVANQTCSRLRSIACLIHADAAAWRMLWRPYRDGQALRSGVRANRRIAMESIYVAPTLVGLATAVLITRSARRAMHIAFALVLAIATGTLAGYITLFVVVVSMVPIG
jgi:hypothetical protein